MMDPPEMEREREKGGREPCEQEQDVKVNKKGKEKKGGIDR